MSGVILTGWFWPVFVALLLIGIFLTVIVLRDRPARVVTGLEAMIGQIGVARTELAPEGWVFVRGELWNARANANVAQGTKVRIDAVEGLTLRVVAVG
jgi:membrane-bound serine protease (ClpP class)